MPGSDPAAIESGTDPLEIVQTREFTARERRELLRRWRSLASRETDRWYTVVGYLWYGFAAFFAISVLMAVQSLKPFSPNLAGQLLVAGVGFAIVMALADRLHWQLAAQRYFAHRAGDRYAIGESEFKATSARRAFVCQWIGIETIAETDDQLVAAISPYHAMFIVKAAFENQDVDAFCAELTRRWQQSRAETASVV